jgi:hypothetical protein
MYIYDVLGFWYIWKINCPINFVRKFCYSPNVIILGY